MTGLATNPLDAPGLVGTVRHVYLWRRVSLTKKVVAAGLIGIGAMTAISASQSQTPGVVRCVRGSEVRSALTPPGGQPEAVPSVADRQGALRAARDRAIRLVRDSIGKARESRLEAVTVSVSFLAVRSLDDALGLASAAHVDVRSVAWGFPVPEKYNRGEINVYRQDGSRRPPSELLADYHSFIDIRTKHFASLTADASPYAVEEAAAVRAARDGIPVVGVTGTGQLDAVAAFAATNPQLLVAVNDPSCGSPLVVLPEESIRVGPDRSSDSGALTAPRPS